jgi:hypothetical protein
MGDNNDTVIAQHRARSEQVLSLLRKDRIDLDAERPIDIFFWCGTRENARSLSRELTAAGFTDVLIGQEESGPRWSAQGRTMRTPNEVAGEDFTREQVALAERHGGEYDGWGTRH